MRSVRLQLGDKAYEMPVAWGVEFPEDADPMRLYVKAFRSASKRLELTMKETQQVLYAGATAAGYERDEKAFNQELSAHVSLMDGYLLAATYVSAFAEAGPEQPVQGTTKKKTK